LGTRPRTRRSGRRRGSPRLGRSRRRRRRSHRTRSETEAPSAEQQAEGAKAIQDLENTSPEEYQKKSAKLPKQLTTPGKLPPKDDKPAGGGGDSQTFK
jgi:hypothetical protein